MRDTRRAKRAAKLRIVINLVLLTLIYSDVCQSSHFRYFVYKLEQTPLENEAEKGCCIPLYIKLRA